MEGQDNKKCTFCSIVSGELPAHRIYEDERHLAFLDIFPSVRGQTLVIPKFHYSSYVFAMPEKAYSSLMDVTREVVQFIDKGLKTVRTCMVMEGMEVDHAHIKLYPIHTVIKTVADGTIDLNEYRGFISTLHGNRAEDSELASIAEKIINSRI